MLVTVALSALLAQPLAMQQAQSPLKLRVGIAEGAGWEKIQSGNQNKDSFREVLADLIRSDGRFEVVLLKPEPLGGSTLHLQADVFVEPIILSAKQETSRQRVPSALGGLVGGGVSGSVATSTADVELRIVTRAIPNGAALAETSGKGKHSATAIDAYNRETGAIDVGDLRKTDIGVAVERAAKEALKDFGKNLSKVRWKAVVASAQDGKVIVNRGKPSGLVPGMTLQVLEVGKPVMDPVTGAVLAAGEETEVARLKVVRVDDQMATCDIVSGGNVQVLQIVRFVASD